MHHCKKKKYAELAAADNIAKTYVCLLRYIYYNRTYVPCQGLSKKVAHKLMAGLMILQRNLPILMR